MRDLASLMSSTGVQVPEGWGKKASNPCLWSGVSCSASESFLFSVVTKLNLSNSGISSPMILACICPLDTLQSLDFSRNSIADLPARFVTSDCDMMASLTALNLSSNRLIDQLQDFSGFRQLEILDLSFNYLNGSVGTKLSCLRRLRSLNLAPYFQ
jgi:Leucine-rich repeat (LRR) protein